MLIPSSNSWLYISDHQVRVGFIFKEYIIPSRERNDYLFIKVNLNSDCHSYCFILVCYELYNFDGEVYFDGSGS